MLSLSAYTFLFTISAIGISEVSYLIRKRKAAEAPVCPIGENCAIVLTSKYNRLLGIHNDIIGLLFYISSAIILGLIVIYGENNITALLASIFYLMLAGATFMSLVFFYLQWRVIKAWCFWCLMSALTILLMDAIVIIDILNT